MINGTSAGSGYNGQSQASPASSPGKIESQKMVKTYEFHLPMHHIREEEPRSQVDLNKTPPVAANKNPVATQSRYDGKEQGTAYRMTKRRTQQLNAPATNKRDDISSQMLENETVADQQNSLRNLNFIGSSFYGDQKAAGAHSRMN